MHLQQTIRILRRDPKARRCASVLRQYQLIPEIIVREIALGSDMKTFSFCSGRVDPKNWSTAAFRSLTFCRLSTTTKRPLSISLHFNSLEIFSLVTTGDVRSTFRTPFSTKTSASPTLAQEIPKAPCVICVLMGLCYWGMLEGCTCSKAMREHLWVLAWGRNAFPYFFAWSCMLFIFLSNFVRSRTRHGVSNVHLLLPITSLESIVA